MRDALCHFLPRRCFLRLQEVRQIVDDHDESGFERLGPANLL